MIRSFENVPRVRLLRPALLLLMVSLTISCATTMPAPPRFLNGTDSSLNQWLDTRLNVDFAEVRVMHLPLTDAFAGMKMAITRADAPVESLRVSLHADDVTRRQALWLLTQKYDLQMTVENVPGILPTLASPGRNAALVSCARVCYFLRTMLPALLTTLLWSVSVVCATRSTRYLGSAVANLTRLCLATVLLALWAHGFGKGPGRRGSLVFCS